MNYSLKYLKRSRGTRKHEDYQNACVLFQSIPALIEYIDDIYETEDNDVLNVMLKKLRDTVSSDYGINLLVFAAKISLGFPLSFRSASTQMAMINGWKQIDHQLQAYATNKNYAMLFVLNLIPFVQIPTKLIFNEANMIALSNNDNSLASPTDIAIVQRP